MYFKIFNILFNFFPTVLPGAVVDFEADLRGPSSIMMKWGIPENGGPIHGYTITYWDKPESTIEVNVGEDVSDKIN